MTVALQDALALDRSILLSMLRRNWCAHGRTRYFQRMEMVLKALNKSRVESLTERLGTLRSQTLFKKKRKQEEWTLENLSKEDSEVIEMKEILDLLIVRLPAVISRIEAAASALFYELGRGFFMPFNTIAIGAIARIRVILIKIGRQGLVDLQIVMADSKVNMDVDWEKAMQLFVEPETGVHVVTSNTHKTQLKNLGIKEFKSKGIEKVSDVQEEFAPDTSPEMNKGARAKARNLAMDDLGESLDFHENESSTSTATQLNNRANETIDKNQEIQESLKRKRNDKEGIAKKTKHKGKAKIRLKKDIFDEIFGE